MSESFNELLNKGMREGCEETRRGMSTPRRRIYILKQTIVERYFYDPVAVFKEFGWNSSVPQEDFIIETFQRYDGSQFCDDWFTNDASPSVGIELVERWDDE